MVVTEAAAFGVPSVLHTRGIGAADLLVPPKMSISVDFEQEGCVEAANRVRAALSDVKGLAEMGDRACTASLGWDEAAYAVKLAEVVKQGYLCGRAGQNRPGKETKGAQRTGVALADAREGDMRNGGCGMGWC